MEEPPYADINEAELREIETELGHPVTKQLAQWFIRNRVNREAVAWMLEAADKNRVDIGPEVQNIPSIKKAKNRKPVSVLKKVKKKCDPHHCDIPSSLRL
jgi:hypothetical protein